VKYIPFGYRLPYKLFSLLAKYILKKPQTAITAARARLNQKPPPILDAAEYPATPKIVAIISEVPTLNFSIPI